MASSLLWTVQQSHVNLRFGTHQTRLRGRNQNWHRAQYREHLRRYADDKLAWSLKSNVERTVAPLRRTDSYTNPTLSDAYFCFRYPDCSLTD